MTASLLLVEDEIEELAVNLAETRARLAVAMWCLLSPPRLPHDPRQPWPSVGGWTPAEHIEFGIQRKLYEPGRGFGRAQRRGNRITLHDVPYRLTRSASYLYAPLVAMEKAVGGNQCALALLSGARSLYLAQRGPSDLERTERVLHVWRAKRSRRGASVAKAAMSSAGGGWSSTYACVASSAAAATTTMRSTRDDDSG